MLQGNQTIKSSWSKVGICRKCRAIGVRIKFYQKAWNKDKFIKWKSNLIIRRNNIKKEKISNWTSYTNNWSKANRFSIKRNLIINRNCGKWLSRKIRRSNRSLKTK